MAEETLGYVIVFNENRVLIVRVCTNQSFWLIMSVALVPKVGWKKYFKEAKALYGKKPIIRPSKTYAIIHQTVVKHFSSRPLLDLSKIPLPVEAFSNKTDVKYQEEMVLAVV
ncbi:MAG: hypothetical protein Q8Q24_01280 [bacterium]|nr:hypothetical protein [bacterium]